MSKPKRSRADRKRRAASPTGKDDAALLARAQEARAAGDLPRAARFLRKFLDTRPEHPEVWYELGAILFETGKFDAALDALEQAAALAPAHAEIHSDLGGLYLQAGRYADAERALRAALAIDPDAARVRYNLASALYAQDRVADTIALLTQLVSDTPEFAEAHFNLGVAQRESGHLSRAVKSFEKARLLQPHSPARLELARCFRELKTPERALDHYRDCHRPGADPVVAVEYAECLHELGDTAAAVALLESERVRFPTNEGLLFCLGQLAHVAGRIEEAEHTYTDCLNANPDSARALVALSRVRRVEDPADPIVEFLAKRVARAGTQAHPALHFALGKVYDDLNAFDDAFAHYAKGNALWREHLDYDRRATETLYRQVMDALPAAAIAGLQTLGNDSCVPVFVVGMPRSGTTLVEQILDRHTAITGAGELQFFPSLAHQLPRLLGSSIAFPACIGAMDGAIVRTICDNYLDLLRRHARDALRIVDKLPGNYLYLGLIKGLFPNARIISCRRDPLDVALSVYFQFFAQGHDYAWDLGDIAHMYRQYDAVMSYWHEQLPGAIYELAYEDIVSDLEGAARRLLQFLDVPFDDRCLRFHESERSVRTASNWQVRQPLYGTSVARWKHYSAHLKSIIAELAPYRA